MAQKIIKNLLDLANIDINGNQPWDIQINNNKFYHRVLKQHSLGLGESYMEGWWDAEKLDQFFFKLLSAKLDQIFIKTIPLKNNIPLALNYIYSKLINKQSKYRSLQVAATHYNLQHSLFSNMLGPTLNYSCGYFKNTNNLDMAQNQKNELICKKLQLKSNDNILEIGCGWGGFAEYVTTHYDCKVTAINISTEQIKYAQQHRSNPNITFYCCDWRDNAIYNPNNIIFDKAVSIGMYEHVGYKNYSLWMNLINRQLKDHGLFLLHSIGRNTTTTMLDPWITKYIFPNGMLPSIKQISEATEKYFIIEDLHNFGAYYDKTLMLWYKNFQHSWEKIKIDYTEEFYHLWKYYLLSCAGMFRARTGQLWQLVLSKNGLPGGYNSIR